MLQCKTGRRNWLVLLAAVAVFGGLGSIGVGSLLQDKGKSDLNGDALPGGALARMGTLRWRHAEAVHYVAYTPDGKAVLTAGQDNIIKLWERETGKEIRRFAIKEPVAQPQPVRPGGVAGWGVAGLRLGKVAMSDDGKFVAAVLANNAIQLWDVNTGKEVRQLKGTQYAVTAFVFAPDGKSLAARTADRSTYLIDTENGNVLRQIKAAPFKGGAGGVAIGVRGNLEAIGVAFSPDGKFLATAELEFGMKRATYVKITDTQTGKEIHQIDTTGNGTSSIAYSPDGKLLAIGSNLVVHLREADTGKEIRQIKMPIGTNTLVFSADSKILAAKGRDQVIRLLDPNNGSTIHQLESAVGLLNANVQFGFFGAGVDARDFAFAPDSKVLAVVSGPTLRFWNVGTGKEQPLAGGHRAAVSTVMLSPDGKMLVSRGLDGTIRRWDASTGNELGQFNEPQGTIAAAFSANGQTVALANADGTIRLHAIADGKQLHQLKGHQNGIAGLAFSADSKLFASRGAVDKLIRIFDVAKGTEIREITLPVALAGAGNNFYGTGTGQGLTFAPDGLSIAGNLNMQSIDRPAGQPARVVYSSTIHIWDVSSAKELRKIIMPAGRAANVMAYAPDGRLLATENTDLTVSVYELASGKERVLLGQPGTTLAPQATSGVMFIGGGGNFARGVKIYSTLAFSPDGGLLVTRGPDHGVRVWNVNHAKEIALLKGHAGEIQSITIASDGKSAASGSADTTALVWDLANLPREPNAPAVVLAPKQLGDLWNDLLSNDAGKAGNGIRTLISATKQAVPFLSEQIKPAAAIDVKKIDVAITDLSSSNFQKRTIATSTLEKFGELAVPALKKALASDPNLETHRRIESLIEKASTGDLNGEQLRVVRAIEMLEKTGTPEARQLLQSLAHGAPGALLTRQAQQALDNLTKKVN